LRFSFVSGARGSIQRDQVVAKAALPVALDIEK